MKLARRLLTVKEITAEALKIIKDSYAVPVVEYHARRTNHDPTLWKVVEVHRKGKVVVEEKELATDLKRNRAQALVRLLRSNQQHGS